MDGCYHVYLDVGSNIGIQVRKLFEPHLYPKAKVHKIFDHFFGQAEFREISDICVVGFEPNPNHTTYLKGTLYKEATKELSLINSLFSKLCFYINNCTTFIIVFLHISL